MFDILSILPGKKKLTGSNWHSFNAVCCFHRGHKADRRSRGGIRFEDDNNFTYNCFNCGFKCKFVLGKSISKNLRQLLEWCGMEDTQIKKWNLESLQHKDLIDYVKVKKEKLKVKFKEHTLPPGELLDETNPLHKVYIDYLQGRGINYRDYPFLITPNEPGRMGNRIIIPYTYQNKVVGNISRFLDNKIPKYLKEQQPGYVFGLDFQKPDWPVCIVTEGIFDAISLNACAITQNTFNEDQVAILTSLHRKIIFVPHRDSTGLSLCEQALALGYSVSIPNWEPGVKDINDAVVKYGKLPTLLSIMQSATTSVIKVTIQRRHLLGNRI